MSPLPGSVQPSPSSVVILLNQNLDPATVSATSVTLVGRGPDLAFGTGDDVLIVPGSVSAAGNVITLDLSSLTLPDDVYRLRLSGTASPPSPHAGLFAQWKLNEGLGTQAADSSGNARHGTLNGADWSTGPFGNALRLNAGATRVDIDAGVVSPGWTAALWLCRTGNVAGTAATILDSNSATGVSLRLEQAAGDDVGITEYTVVDHGFGYVAPLNQWVHLTFTSDGANARLFVNGVLQATASRAFNLHVDKLGSATTARTDSMIGLISEVQVYGRVLANGEIVSLAALTDAVRGVSGQVVDGEFSGLFPSGDSSAGGDFAAFFSVSSTPPVAPRATAMTPSPGSTVASRPASIFVTFDRGIEPATAAASTVRVIRAGTDGLLGTGDDVPVPLDAVHVLGGNPMRIDLYDPFQALPRDLYRVILSGTVVTDPPEIARWMLDEAAGSAAADSSGNGHDGTHVNGPAVIPGKIGRALALSGTTQSVDIADADALSPQIGPSGQITVSAWIRIPSWPAPGGSFPILSKGSTGQQEYAFRVGFDQALRFQVFQLNGMVYTEVNAATISSDRLLWRWHHVAGTISGSFARAYLDGERIAEWMSFFGPPPPSHGSSPVQIGRTGPAENAFFMGHVDDIRLYGTALTDAQVVNLANLGGAVRDANQRVLDGEFSGSFPSGDGAAGGDFVATYFLDVPAPFTLVSPANGASLLALMPTFSWTASAFSTSYTLEVARDTAFTQIEFVQTGISSTTFTLPVLLPGSAGFYWRVKAMKAGTGTIATGAPFSFTTGFRVDVVARSCGSTGIEALILLALGRLLRRIRSA